MDHLYPDYFLNLAQVSIGFVGFSTICVVLREMMGKPLDRFQTLLVRFDAELWLNALTPIFHFSVGPYAIGVTWVLTQAGIILLNTFGEFMRTER